MLHELYYEIFYLDYKLVLKYLIYDPCWDGECDMLHGIIFFSKQIP